MIWLELGLLGVAAGVVSGLFGVGGAVVIVPGLVLLARLPQHSAHGTSLAALLPAVGIFGVLEYHRRGQVNIPYAVAIAAGIFLGAFLGAKLAGGVPEPLLRKLFGGFLLLVSVRLLVF